MSITTMTLDELKKLPPLTEKEIEIIRNAKATPTPDCPEMTAEELEDFRPYQKAKKSVTINLDTNAICYFKELAEETGIAYQNLINLFLVQCAKEKKRPVFL